MQATRTTAEHRWRCNPSPRGCGVERLPALRYPIAGAVWTTAPTRGPSELRQRGCAQRSAAARPHCAIAAVRAEICLARKVLTDGARLDNSSIHNHVNCFAATTYPLVLRLMVPA